MLKKRQKRKQKKEKHQKRVIQPRQHGALQILYCIVLYAEVNNYETNEISIGE